MNLKRLALSACSALLLSACYNIEYTGEALSPELESRKVVMYFSEDQIPKDSDWRVLGDAVATAGTDWTASALEMKLRAFAAEKGANGVLVSAVDRIPEGMARPDQIKNQQAKTWDVDGTTGSSYQYFKEDMLNYGNLGEPEQEVYRLRILAKLISVEPKRKPEEKPAKAE